MNGTILVKNHKEPLKMHNNENTKYSKGRLHFILPILIMYVP